MVNERSIKAVFSGSLKLKPAESCLIITDTVKEPIGRAFYEYARRIAPGTEMMVIEPTAEHGTEPPAEVAAEMLKYDVQLLITEKSLTHTRARINATARGARIATMPTITEDIANRCLDIDYAALEKESNRVYDILKNAGEVRVTTDLGTDVVFTVGKSGFFGQNGGSFDRPGAYGNLPEGEVAFAPETAEGACVIDACFADLGLLRSPVTFRIKGGMVTDIEGPSAEAIRKRLDRVGPMAYKVAELGIGLNPKAKIIGNILEDEKVIGTVHVAVGNNLSFGGDNDVPLHLDGVITLPTVTADGKVIMDRGRFAGRR